LSFWDVARNDEGEQMFVEDILDQLMRAMGMETAYTPRVKRRRRRRT